MTTPKPNLASAPSLRSRVIRRVCAPAAVFVLGLINWRYPFVRFDSQLANQVAFLGVLLLPIAASIAGTGVSSLRTRWLLRLPLAPFAIVGVLLGLPAAIGLLDTARLGFDPSFEPIARYALHSRGLTVYRTNCGAPCSFGIVVREERPLVPGLLWVRDVYREYPADTVELRVLGGDRFEIGVPSRRGHPNSSGSRDTVSLPGR
jgi:hypothetical protein